MCFYKFFPGRSFSSIFQLKLKLFLQCLMDFLISFFFYLIFHHIFEDGLYFHLFFSLPKNSPTFASKLFCCVFLGATPYFGDIMLFIISAAFLIKSFGFSLFFYFFNLFTPSQNCFKFSNFLFCCKSLSTSKICLIHFDIKLFIQIFFWSNSLSVCKRILPVFYL